jgi:hypothetical protein
VFGLLLRAAYILAVVITIASYAYSAAYSAPPPADPFPPNMIVYWNC